MLRQLKAKLSRRATRTQPGAFRADRARLVHWCLLGLFGVIATRATLLHLFPAQSHALQHIADNQYQQEIDLAPYRGAIYDHRGEALAISVKRPSLAINPRLFRPSSSEMTHLARILKITPQKIRRLNAKKSYFAWLARKLDPRVADEVMNLELAGLVQISEPARYYPAGYAAAQVLGFVGVDNMGLGGLERQFDKDLKGKAFKVMASKDARGKFIVSEATGAAPERTGNSVYLTIDRVIQEIAEEELAAGVRKTKAKKGFAIVSDPHTGRVLAVANYPSFDPNSNHAVSQIEARNTALLDTFEPGSVAKPFVIAQAIESKSTYSSEVHDCDNGALRIGKHTIHDDHAAATLTTAQTLIRSSNICTFKIANKMGKEATFNAFKAFGFSTPNALLGFPGETIGYISDFHKWATIRFANVAFGHGFAVTGLELIQAMGALANGGHLMKPVLVERVLSSDGLIVSSTPTQVVREVVSPATARIMRGLLEQVVSDELGTGKKAATNLYTVAGKTGTAQKVEPGIKGYAKGKYIGSFIGFAPVQDPHLVIYVLVDEPSGLSYYGGVAAAPVFAGIAERSLKYLNVAPDKPAKGDTALPPAIAKGEPHGHEAATRKL